MHIGKQTNTKVKLCCVCGKTDPTAYKINRNSPKKYFLFYTSSYNAHPQLILTGPQWCLHKNGRWCIRQRMP